MKIFTQGMIKFLEENAGGKTFKNIAVLFNKHFKANFTRDSIKNAMYRHEISTGLYQKKWTPEIKEYAEKNYKNVLSRELMTMINARFETNFTISSVKHFLYYFGLRKGNKNNFYPVGSERIDSKGYKVIKIAMRGQKGTLWKEKHRLIWEQAHGAIPKGHVICFLDGNRQNCALENLAMLTRREVVKMNQLDLFSNKRKVTLAGIAVVKHSIETHKRFKEMVGPEKHKLFNNEASRKRIKARKKNRIAQVQTASGGTV